MSKFEYRIIKSSWGIAIDITGNHSISEKIPSFGNQISTEIWLDLSSVPKLQANEKIFIENAIVSVNKQIASKIGNSKFILIQITTVDFNPCDYQSEGLFCAVIYWAAKEFNFTAPDINVDFNKIDNQYRFFVDGTLVKS